jgi:GntR family transcriptional regulator/MocR family aminotransferase
MTKTPSGTAPILALDRKLSKPLHRQIYDAYRTAIVERRIRPGQRIPSTRVLAVELGVSRFPVLNAYAQLLAEGYFESRVGAGTVVSGSLPEQSAWKKLAVGHPPRAQSGPRSVASRTSIRPKRETHAWLTGLGAFGVGQVAADQFPLHIWSNLVAKRSRSMGAKSFHYGDQMGTSGLRETIADYLRTARSLNCEAGQIMIVSGSQQALEITTRVLLDPGSHVWVENPGYHLAKAVLAVAGCQLVPVPVDQEGLNVAEGIKLSPKARVALVTPSHQFPLGHTMSASRRLQLLEWAQRSGSWVVEDDYDSEYRYESMPIASLQGLDVNSRVIYVGTFSKVIFPSLRLGYLVLPPDLVERFVSIRSLMDLGPSTLFQDVLSDFMGEGHFARHIRRMRTLYHERRTVLVDSIRRAFGSGAEVLGSEAGMHLTVVWRNQLKDVEIANRAALHHLWAWPLSHFYLGEARRSGFVLGFGGTPVEEIPAAVRKLRAIVAS